MASQQSSSGSSQGTSVSSTQYPVDIEQLVNQANAGMGNLKGSYSNINNFLQNPLSGELFQPYMQALLQARLPGEEASRTALADQFRMAGGGQGGALQSGAFSNAAVANEQNIMQGRSADIAKAASDTYRNTLAGLGLQFNAAQAPTALTTNLIGAIKPLSQSSSQQSSQQSSSGASQDPAQSSSQYSGYSKTPTSSGGTGTGSTSSGGSTSSSTSSGGTDPGGATGGGGYGVIWNPVTGAWESNSQGGGVTPDPADFTGYYPVDEYGYTEQDWEEDPYYN